MDDQQRFRAIPNWALEMEKTQKAATAWGDKQRGDLGTRWGDLMRQDFQANLASLGYDINGQYTGAMPDPEPPTAPSNGPPQTVDPSQRYLGPDTATAADVQALAPQGAPPAIPTASQVVSAAPGLAQQAGATAQDVLSGGAADRLREQNIATLAPKLGTTLEELAPAFDQGEALGMGLAGGESPRIPGAAPDVLSRLAGAAVQKVGEVLPKIGEAASSIGLPMNREVTGAVGGALYNLQDQPPQQEGESTADYWKRLGITTAERAAGGAGLAAFTRPGVRQALGNVASQEMRIVPSSPFNDPTLRRVEQAYSAPATRATTPLPARLERAFVNFRQQFTDRDAPLEVWQPRAAKAYGGPLPPDMEAYYLNRLNPDRAAEVNVQEGLQPAIQSVGDDLHKLETYLTLHDNVDAAAATGNPARRFSLGLTAADSAAKIPTLLTEVGPQRATQIEDAARQVWDFGKSLLQKKLDAGIISQDLFNELTTRYPHYVPTRILDYLKDDAPGLANGRSLSLRDNGLRRLTEEGTNSARETPLGSMVRYAYDAEAAARRNTAATAFLKDGQVMGMVGTQAAPITGGINPVREGYSFKRGEAPLVLFQNGVKQTYAVPADVATAIKQEGIATFPAINTLMSLFKMAATSRNPAFLAGNTAIDAPAYVMRTMAREGGSPTKLPGILADLGRGYWDAMKGLTTGTYSGQTADFLREGGGQFGFFQRSEEGTRKSLNDLTRTSAFQMRNGADLKRFIGQIVSLKPVEALGERIELGPRVAAYNRALKAGKNTNEAVIDGRTVTLDFAQGGNFTKTLNQFIPFFNVGVQGALTLPRVVKENPRGAIATAASLLVAPTLGAEAWNHATPERAQDYADVPQYVKNQGIVVMLPTEAPTNERGERQPQYALIRLREYMPIVQATREVTDRVMGEQGQDGWDVLSGALSQTTPIQGPSQAIFPGVSTAVQLGVDKNAYTGQNIATRYNDEQASPLSRGGAAAINAGANVLGFHPDVRPSQVEFATRDVGGGVAGAAHGLATGIAGEKQQSGLPQDIPVAGGLIGRFVGARTGGELDRAQKERLAPGHVQMLYDLGLRPDVGTVRAEINGSPLTRQEAAQYQRLANEYVGQALDKLDNDPRFQRLGTAGQAIAVQKDVTAAHARAQKEMVRSIGAAEMVSRKSGATDRREALGVR